METKEKRKFILETEISVVKKIQKEYEIPSYYKSENGYVFYCIFNNEKAIQVRDYGDWSSGIQVIHNELALNDTTEIKSDEYYAAFEMVNERLKELTK